MGLPLWLWLTPNPNLTMVIADTMAVDTMVDTADTTVTVTSASVPLMLSPRPSPKLRPPLSLNPRLRLMPMLGATTVIPVTMVDTTVIPDTDTDTVIIITASVPLNPNLTTDTDTVDTDMAVTDTMVNFAQTDQVTRISNPKIRPEQKNYLIAKLPSFSLPCKSKRTE